MHSPSQQTSEPDSSPSTKKQLPSTVPNTSSQERIAAGAAISPVHSDTAIASTPPQYKTMQATSVSPTILRAETRKSSHDEDAVAKSADEDAAVSRPTNHRSETTEPLCSSPAYQQRGAKRVKTKEMVSEGTNKEDEKENTRFRKMKEPKCVKTANAAETDEAVEGEAVEVAEEGEGGKAEDIDAA